MIDNLIAIAEFLKSIVALVINTIHSIFWVSSTFDEFVLYLNSVFAYCPTPLLIFLQISLSLTILFAFIKLM